MEISDAGLQVIDGITAIYNDAVEHTTAIWNETPIDTSNRRARLAARENVGYPVLVAVDATGGVRGYVSFVDLR